MPVIVVSPQLTGPRPGGPPNTTDTSASFSAGSGIFLRRAFSPIHQTTTFTKGGSVAMPSSAITMVLQPSFKQDFYYRTHTSVTTLDVGNLTTTVVQNVEVWNAYFEPKTLSSVVGSGTAGVTLEGIALPAVLGPLVSEQFVLTVSLAGPPTIATTYAFNWGTPADNFTIYISGSRVVTLENPFLDTITETWEWVTSVMMSYDGSTEQRSRMRALPRRSLASFMQVPPLQRAAMFSKLYGWVGRVFACPVWQEAQRALDVAPGATSISVDTRFINPVVGGLFFLWNPIANEVVEVASFNDTTVTFTEPLNNGFKTPWVMPAKLAVAEGGVIMYSTTMGYDDRVPVSVEVTDLTENPAAASPVQFLGDDVYTDEPWLQDAGIDEDIRIRQDVVDTRLGPVVRYTPWSHPLISRPHRFVVQGLEDCYNFVRWMHRRAGRLRAFWQPSFKSDMRVIPTGTITNVVVIYAADIALYSSERKHAALKFKDGTWFFRTITGVTSVGDGTETVTLDGLPIGRPAADVEVFCFLSLKRLTTDRVELQWGPNRTCICEVGIIEVKP